MRNISHLLLLLLPLQLFFSCHRKQNIIHQEMFTDADGRVMNIERFVDHDSVFQSSVNTKTGLQISLTRASSEKNFQDSTFNTVIYYDDGKLKATQNFTKGKPDGAWISWFENGQRESETVLHLGILLSYHTWNDKGTPQVDASRYNNGSMIRYEYYPSGEMFQEFETDSLGNGKCTTYFLNSQKSAEGNLFHFKPSGLWKRYDSLGKSLPDTMYGLMLK